MSNEEDSSFNQPIEVTIEYLLTGPKDVLVDILHNMSE